MPHYNGFIVCLNFEVDVVRKLKLIIVEAAWKKSAFTSKDEENMDELMTTHKWNTYVAYRYTTKHVSYTNHVNWMMMLKNWILFKSKTLTTILRKPSTNAVHSQSFEGNGRGDRRSVLSNSSWGGIRSCLSWGFLQCSHSEKIIFETTIMTKDRETNDALGKEKKKVMKTKQFSGICKVIINRDGYRETGHWGFSLLLSSKT